MLDIIVMVFFSICISIGLTEFIQPNQLDIYGVQGYLFSVALYSGIVFIIMCLLVSKGSETK